LLEIGTVEEWVIMFNLGEGYPVQFEVLFSLSTSVFGD
jgi:hypothetical protein